LGGNETSVGEKRREKKKAKVLRKDGESKALKTGNRVETEVSGKFARRQFGEQIRMMLSKTEGEGAKKASTVRKISENENMGLPRLLQKRGQTASPRIDAGVKTQIAFKGKTG